MSDFVKRLNQLMNENKISQNKLSEITGITQSSISDWANGKYKPRQDKVYLLSEALKVSPAYLLGYSDNKNLDQKSTTNNTSKIDKLFNQLNDEGKGKAISYTQDLVDSGKYKKTIKEDTSDYITTIDDMRSYLMTIPMAAFDGKLNPAQMNDEEIISLYKLLKDNE
ncbi:helix-turn-helix domain-containing protein [Anaerococcus marasmi]|uniref:helix-turn-helix domain-containing protein n=1 Tax=Anaerococcus marasmi TaxID=2057797 RepID=UPI000CFA4D35|nr:helix-turn-helix transcriptional regulator [Anaerococcus marasmi]